MTPETARTERCELAEWRPTAAHLRAALVALVLATIAVIWRRPDVLVIAAPFAIVTAWATLARPGTVPTLDDRVAHPTVREGDGTTVRATVDAVDDLDLVTIETAPTPWIERRPARGTAVAGCDGSSAHLSIAVRPVRWGRHCLEPVHVTGIAAWAAFRWEADGSSHTITALAVPPVFDTSGPVHPRDGLVGIHRSARPGDGGEFAGIRPYQSGDRIRRINWARSSRDRELRVNATWADEDLHVALVLDVTDDVGESEGVDGSASSLDLAVRAAGAIAEHYGRRGDRVSLRSVGSATAANVPPASGTVHLRRILDSLAVVAPSHAPSIGQRVINVGRHDVAGALTVMLSPLISSAALNLAVSLGRHGRSVMVVDTLPDHVVVDDDEHTALAWRIRLLERRREIRAVQEVGVPVVRWRGPGSLDQFLHEIARHASAPRMRSLR